MSVRASAPGKLVLTGEYAVLEGAPAVVLALDRRARVTLAPAAADTYVIDAPDLGVHDAVTRLDSRGRLYLAGGEPAANTALAVVAAVIESVAAEHALPGFRAAMDTHPFFSSAGGHAKFGLGSSAALTVALAGALHAHAGLGLPAVDCLIRAHQSVQGGRGSGLDIAASLTGGVILYQRCAGRAQISPLGWPDGLLFSCAWSMRAASTGVFLRGLAAWRERAPARYTALVRELAVCAETAVAALVEQNVNALLETIGAYVSGLVRLGEASGLDIVSAEHQVLATIAATCGVVYKPCGAGGGDIGIALATDAERLQAFRQRVARAGMQTLAVRLEPDGLQVN